MAGQLEYSATPSSNTTVNGIGIQGSSTIKNGDDAMRQLMADAAASITRHVAKSVGSYTALKADFRQLWRATGAVTINLTAAATLTDGWCLFVKADGGDVTVDPNGTEQINGSATALTVGNGSSAFIFCTGTAFYAISIGDVTLAGTQTLTNKTLTSPTITTPSITGNVVVTSTDAGAAGGPDLDLHRNSATPAVADILARLLFNGEDSAGNKELYALIQALLIDPTSTSEDGQIDFQTVIAGALASRMKLGAGLMVGTPTGGDPGAGKVNATDYQINGVPVSQGVAKAWVSFNGTGTVAIRDSFNVSSITDNGTGDYTVNFAAALANANSTLNVNVGSNGTSALIFPLINAQASGAIVAPTTSAMRFATFNSGVGPIDLAYISAVVMGD